MWPSVKEHDVFLTAVFNFMQLLESIFTNTSQITFLNMCVMQNLDEHHKTEVCTWDSVLICALLFFFFSYYDLEMDD